MFDGCNYVFRDRIWLRVIRCWWSPHRWRNSWNFADLNWGSPSELRISFKTSCADNWLSLSSSELRYSVQTRLRLSTLTQMRIIVAQLLRQLLISTIVLFNRRKCWADLPSSLNFCNNSIRRRSCYLLDGNVERFRSRKSRCSVVGKKTRTD